MPPTPRRRTTGSGIDRISAHGRDLCPSVDSRLTGRDQWYDADMSHTGDSSHTYAVRLRERGRLVLPAELRRQAGLQTGDELVASLLDGDVRLVGRRELARRARGSLLRAATGRDLVAELLAERRADAEAD